MIFLRGGADGLTLVAPVADDAYHRARPTLRVNEREGLRLDDVFALHPRLAPLAPLWASGELAIVHRGHKKGGQVGDLVSQPADGLEAIDTGKLSGHQG